MAKPKIRNVGVAKTKEGIHTPYNIHDDSTTLGKSDPKKADMTVTKMCYVRLERLAYLENSTSVSTRELRQPTEINYRI